MASASGSRSRPRSPAGEAAGWKSFHRRRADVFDHTMRPLRVLNQLSFASLPATHGRVTRMRAGARRPSGIDLRHERGKRHAARRAAIAASASQNSGSSATLVRCPAREKLRLAGTVLHAPHQDKLEPRQRPGGGLGHHRVGSAGRCAAEAGAPGSPELPIAISTLRTKRSRPIRLIGEPANGAGTPASSSAASRPNAGRRGRRGRAVFPAAWPGEAVPGADGEAVVAAVDAIAHRRAQLVRDRARDARSSDRRCSAWHRAGTARERRRSGSRQAARAGAAAIRVRRVGREVERGVDLAQEQPGAVRARDEIGVLALPADARRLASGFSITGAVSTNTFTPAPEARDDELRQMLEHPLDHVVVVAAAGIDRDAAAIGPASTASGSPSGA